MIERAPSDNAPEAAGPDRARRRRLTAALLAGAAAVSTPPADGAPGEPPSALAAFQEAFTAVVREASAAVVKVRSENNYASGVLVSPDGLVFTNRRVATQAVGAAPEVILSDGTVARAQLLATDAVHDAALLKIEGSDLPHVPLAPEDPDRGAWVAVIGKAFFREKADLTASVKMALADSNSVTLGTVNARDALSDPERRRAYKGTALFIDALINPGCEGGAVVDTAGRLVGIVAQLQDDARTWDELDFAAPASVLRALAQEARAPIPAPSASSFPFWSDLSEAFARAVDRAAPGVVQVLVEHPPPGIVAIPAKGGPGPFTGVVIDTTGHILTSAAHFPEDRPPQAVAVVDAAGARHPARLLGRDHRTDLVLLKTESDGPFTPPVFAGPDDARPGQFAIAASASFGPPAARALHVGIVSAVDRDHGAVQTDATLLLANRGGPLLDLDGRVLGLFTQLQRQPERDMEQKNGVAFAIPLARIEPVLDRLKRGETLKIPYVGVGFPPPPGQNEQGCLVVQVVPGGPAARAGLKEADLVVALDGHRILNAVQFRKRLQAHLPGERVILRVERIQDGEPVRLDLPVTLEAAPEGGR